MLPSSGGVRGLGSLLAIAPEARLVWEPPGFFTAKKL